MSDDVAAWILACETVDGTIFFWGGANGWVTDPAHAARYDEPDDDHPIFSIGCKASWERVVP